jgi:rSAM/selenodomain-associated transferase 2
MPKPDLSIIIPTLNEATALPLLLGDLQCQQGLALEVIVSDGGSADATRRTAEERFASGQLTGACLVGPGGRGRQLNAGASAAHSDWLLFLHADSRLADASLLRNALEFMHAQQKSNDSDALAGHFSLQFDLPDDRPLFGLYFHEVKAALGRPGCIHGDQGMLLSRAFFQRVGPFREDLPIMEDITLAERIRVMGEWLLLPGVLTTSARRFRSEGFRERQTLNALLMNFLMIGWPEFIARSPAIYRQQDQAQPLQLLPFFRLIDQLLQEMPFSRRWSIWLATGAYVRSQAWQIGLALDCRKAVLSGEVKPTLPGDGLNFFVRRFEPLTNHAAGRWMTTLLVWAWYQWQLRIRHT